MTAYENDVLLDRPVPQSPDAERAVLGSILINNRAMFRVDGIANADDFFHGGNRTIFGVMAYLISEGVVVDLLTVKEELQRIGKLDEVGGFAYITSLIDVVPDVANVERYAHFIARASKLRRILTAASNAMRAVMDAGEPEEIAADAIDSLTPDASREDRQARQIGECIDEAYRDAEARRDQNASPALASGFPELDSFEALVPGRLVAVGAPSNHGKSALMMNLAAGFGQKGNRTLIFSLESPPKDLSWRHVASQSGVPHSRLRDWRRLGDADMPKLRQVQRDAAKLPVYLSRSLRSIDEIYAECRRVKAVRGLEVVLIDYVQLIECASERDEVRRLAVVSQRLLKLAIEQNLLVIILSQLNEERKKREGRLHQSDLKGARAIGESSRVVLLFQRPHADDKANPALRPCEVLFQVEKNNEGRTGDYPMHFDEVTQRFADGDCQTNNCRHLPRQEANKSLFA